MSLDDLKKKLIEQENQLKTWRNDEDKTESMSCWDIGYNDGFEDCLNAIKRALER